MAPKVAQAGAEWARDEPGENVLHIYRASARPRCSGRAARHRQLALADPAPNPRRRFTPLAAGEAGPTGITAGNDGALWFTAFDANAIGRITPAGVVTHYSLPSPSDEPSSIVSGSDGALGGSIAESAAAAASMSLRAAICR